MKNMKKTKREDFKVLFFFLEHFCLPAGSLYSVAVQYFPLHSLVSATLSVFEIFLLYQCIEITKQPVPSLHCECYRTCN